MTYDLLLTPSHLLDFRKSSLIHIYLLKKNLPGDGEIIKTMKLRLEQQYLERTIILINTDHFLWSESV